MLDKCEEPEAEEYVNLLLNVLAIHHAFTYLKKNDEEKKEAHFPIFLFLQVLLKIPVEACYLFPFNFFNILVILTT